MFRNAYPRKMKRTRSGNNPPCVRWGKISAPTCALALLASLMNLADAQDNLFSSNSSSVPSHPPTSKSFSSNENTTEILFSSSPSSLPSVIARETPVPSFSSMPTPKPTYEPTNVASSSPSLSSSPTSVPSAWPTHNPTVSSEPSISPSMSKIPSSTPSFSPTQSPIIAPSTAPSKEFPVSYVRSYIQNIYVSVPQSFTAEETKRFQYLMEQYTAYIGYNITDPHILTESTMTSQNIGINPTPIPSRRTQTNRNKKYLRHVHDRLGKGQHDIEDGRNDSPIFLERLPGIFYNNRNLQTTDAYLLSVKFSMEYTTRKGYDISDYNQLFADFVNSNTTRVANDLSTKYFLPVLSAGPVIMLKTGKPTSKPTEKPTMKLTERPSHYTMSPTALPSSYPTSSHPSISPSESPTQRRLIIDSKSDSFVLGLSLGLSGALIVALMAYCYIRHREKAILKESATPAPMTFNTIDKRESNGQVSFALEIDGSEKANEVGEDDVYQHSEGIDMPVIPDSATVGESETNSPLEPLEENFEPSEATDNMTDSLYCEPSQSVLPDSHPVIEGFDFDQYSQSQTSHPNDPRVSVLSNMSLSPENDSSYNNMFALPYQDHDNDIISNNEFFHSESDEEVDPFQFVGGSRDELDDYKNQDLELLRTLIEESIDGVEGLMSMAMTSALMETEDSMSWVIERNHSSIEVTNIFGTFDWLKKNEHSTLESRHEYFQELLNRVVLSVLFEISNPVQGARLAHGCAIILGLDLTKDLPQTVLIIQGLRKMSDLELGRNVVINAFKPFGDIEDAAIVPKRGFGYVRFKQAKAAKKALERFRVSEIEIQDVSVQVKTLKCESPIF